MVNPFLVPEIKRSDLHKEVYFSFVGGLKVGRVDLFGKFRAKRAVLNFPKRLCIKKDKMVSPAPYPNTVLVSAKKTRDVSAAMEG